MLLAESSTWTIKFAVPFVVGVPDMTPAEEHAQVTRDARLFGPVAPDETVHVYLIRRRRLRQDSGCRRCSGLLWAMGLGVVIVSTLSTDEGHARRHGGCRCGRGAVRGEEGNCVALKPQSRARRCAGYLVAYDLEARRQRAGVRRVGDSACPSRGRQGDWRDRSADRVGLGAGYGRNPGDRRAIDCDAECSVD